MKKVEAIIAPYALDTVKELLVRRGCDDIVVSEVRGSHGGPPRKLCYRGTTYLEDPTSVKLETVVQDEEAMPIVEAILHLSDESSRADYQVNVFALEQVISIGISQLVRYERRYHKDRRSRAISGLPRLSSESFVGA